MSEPYAVVSKKGEQRLSAGHPWIYRSDIMDADAEPGDTVSVLSQRKQVLGQALFSDQSQITLRMLTRGHAVADRALWRARIDAAVSFRDTLALDATACRLVNGEADLLPSLVVDRYGDYLVVQALSQGTNRRLPEIVELLVERVRPAGILARNDPKVRSLEGLEREVRLLYGEVPESIPVREGAVHYDVNVWTGQKTGLFLDQRENREAAARYARGRLLDCFSYNGGFALRLAPQCGEVVAMDVSADAVARITANAARNGITNLEAVEANVFDELHRLLDAKDYFDTIVLDPPAFARNKAAVESALAGYKEINLRALGLLTPGGTLVTCSCSYNVTEPMFEAMLQEAAADAGVSVTIVEKRMQGRDHPVLLGVPETYYLKCFILRRVD
ncbi:MAG: class I SAM-dependent rRNA methyltransferase [Vicinamibacterales bacterium]|nr:class I SAM-dependent rRNA methyltransferase [Vicinamibacterales bacterium]